MANPPFLSLLHTLVEASATLAFALSGLLEAARKRLDAVGVCLVAGLAAFGGVLRDIVCNEIPTALHDHRPYAVCAFLGGWAFVLAQHAGMPEGAALVASAATATGLRVLALLTGFTLPRWLPGERR
jgi:uncharacterized membrane protein YeiH